MLAIVRKPLVAAVGVLMMLALTVVPAAAQFDEQHDPGTEAFQRTWARTDKPVAEGKVQRTWMWGPAAFTEVLTEEYADSPGGERQVQYFDKARMEITHPDADQGSTWYVTNGLLVVELVSGNMQVGDDEFVDREPADIQIAGDPDQQFAPTYADINQLDLRNAPATPKGEVIDQELDDENQVESEDDFADYGVTAAYRVQVPGIDHTVASVFWEFMNSTGLVYEDGEYVQDALFENPFYATGYPITEAYWSQVSVEGAEQDVLWQCFERRCLTYTPSNQPGFQVEAGNVGQHYYTWRYLQEPEEPPEEPGNPPGDPGEPPEEPVASLDVLVTVDGTPASGVTVGYYVGGIDSSTGECAATQAGATVTDADGKVSFTVEPGGYCVQATVDGDTETDTETIGADDPAGDTDALLSFGAAPAVADVAVDGEAINGTSDVVIVPVTSGTDCDAVDYGAIGTIATNYSSGDDTYEAIGVAEGYYCSQVVTPADAGTPVTSDAPYQIEAGDPDIDVDDTVTLDPATIDVGVENGPGDGSLSVTVRAIDPSVVTDCSAVNYSGGAAATWDGAESQYEAVDVAAGAYCTLVDPDTGTTGGETYSDAPYPAPAGDPDDPSDSDDDTLTLTNIADVAVENEGPAAGTSTVIIAPVVADDSDCSAAEFGSGTTLNYNAAFDPPQYSGEVAPGAYCAQVTQGTLVLTSDLPFQVAPADPADDEDETFTLPSTLDIAMPAGFTLPTEPAATTAGLLSVEAAGTQCSAADMLAAYKATMGEQQPENFMLVPLSEDGDGLGDPEFEAMDPENLSELADISGNYCAGFMEPVEGEQETGQRIAYMTTTSFTVEANDPANDNDATMELLTVLDIAVTVDGDVPSDPSTVTVSLYQGGTVASGCTDGTLVTSDNPGPVDGQNHFVVDADTSYCVVAETGSDAFDADTAKLPAGDAFEWNPNLVDLTLAITSG